jgi:hypothetical protein
MINAIVIFLGFLVIFFVLLLMGIPSGRVQIVRREPPLSSRLRVKLHQARSRLATTQTKNEIRATSARLRRQLDREMRQGFGDSDG